jgi:dihydroorotate dehydrogenase electron transfer subunit
LTLPQTVHIREIRDDSRTIRTFVLDVELAQAEPGQFIMLWLPGVDEKPMSIACPAPLTVTVARVGPFSTALYQRKVGDRLGWRGPYGRGFSLPRDEGPRALLVSGGSGVGPIYFLATRAVAHDIPTTVALGARTALDLPYVEQFRTLEKVDLILATDDGSAGHKGYVTDVIAQGASGRWQVAGGESQVALYACGPERMLVAIHRLCRERGVPGQVSMERYMKCGFGVCGQCSLDELLVCQDGPVFDVEQLDDLKDFGHAHRSAAGRRMPIR